MIIKRKFSNLWEFFKPTQEDLDVDQNLREIFYDGHRKFSNCRYFFILKEDRAIFKTLYDILEEL